MRIARVCRRASSSMFQVAAREVGQERSDLPLWAARESSAAEAFAFLSEPPAREVAWREVPGVRGGFQLLDLLSAEECRGFIDILDSLGFHSDAAVSLPYNFRHMTNCNLVVPEEVDARLFERCRRLLPDVAGHPPLGLNAKFRCYRYAAGDYFRPHTDGAWPGSRFRDGQYLADAYGDRMSQFTFLILLGDGYEGGSTSFYPVTKTPLGGALCFPHGFHPDSPLHGGSEVLSGIKYIVRSEVLYSSEALKDLTRARHDAGKL
ncbi:unnamed protein product [Polarella glacialis]|uniref:Prolyl 4-hydroxylase alpha subunit domain-containing protein n=1 Tax=Polarella glacialis TaxID=89957 RepID=A0A813EQE4_POLGL|nr:unnamed protein product [Polarella glacialis]